MTSEALKVKFNVCIDLGFYFENPIFSCLLLNEPVNWVQVLNLNASSGWTT